MSTFIGTPCKKCGNTERYISGNHNCIKCAKAYSKRRRIDGKNEEWRKKNKELVNEYNKTRYRALTDEEKKQRLRKQHIRTYGIQPEDYERMLSEQNGVCACCGDTEMNKNKKHLSIDHCHHTGRVRALLCDRCNRGLGAFGDNIDNLRNAVLYLEKYN